MNRKIVSHVICIFIMVTGISIALSGGAGLLMRDPQRTVNAMLLYGLLLSCAAAAGMYLTKPRNAEERKFGFRDAFAIVTLGWFSASITGIFPYYAVAGFPLADAVFETVSGFSTTGATVVEPGMHLRSGAMLPNGIESLSYSILFWRSITHWLGGMGIVVLTIAILPLFNIGGQVLFNAEATGLKSSDTKVAPRIASMAKILWIVYLSLTALETLFLYFGGMTLFDAVCHSFSTIATGGFSTKQLSIAWYHSSYIEMVILVFMFLSGCNFILHIRFFSGRFLCYWKDEEFRIYLLLTLAVTSIITLLLYLTTLKPDPFTGLEYGSHLWNSFRAASFQTVATFTSTGFTTADYTLWNTAAGILLFLLMFAGGCGGSTAGGMKCIRLILVCKQSMLEVRKCIFPHLVPDIRLNGTRVDMTAIQKAAGFFVLFIVLFLLFAFLIPLACPEMDFLTACSASLACLSNIGPGFGAIGPDLTYNWMTPAAKILLSFEMFLGRLELYTVLVFFLPSFWKR